MTDNKPRVRLYVVGKATYRLISRTKGYRGPYGQDWCGAKWACIDCGRIVEGDDSHPYIRLETFTDYEGRRLARGDACAVNGHAPCAYCGKKLPRTNDGCPRAHPRRYCPGKTEADRMVGQHSHSAKHERVKP